MIVGRHRYFEGRRFTLAGVFPPTREGDRLAGQLCRRAKLDGHRYRRINVAQGTAVYTDQPEPPWPVRASRRPRPRVLAWAARVNGPLTPDGERLRRAIGSAGVELTPDQLAVALVEARERVQPGPGGVCVRCKRDGSDGRDFRYGLCDVCAFPHGTQCRCGCLD